MDSKKVAEE